MPLELLQPLVLLLEEPSVLLLHSVSLLQPSSAHVLQQLQQPHVRDQPLAAPASFQWCAHKAC